MVEVHKDSQIYKDLVIELTPAARDIAYLGFGDGYAGSIIDFFLHNGMTDLDFIRKWAPGGPYPVTTIFSAWREFCDAKQRTTVL